MAVPSKRDHFISSMVQPFIIRSLERQPRIVSPQPGISEMREMFSEISQSYMVYHPPSFYYILKRILDLTVSALFLLAIMSWLLPLVALFIKLTSKGPVMFIQKRTGRRGVEFNCYKFRTMFVNDEAETKQASAGDKRITLAGKMLRLTHIDETPQFFNVLRGDMSIVGPRPHMLYHTRYYSQIIPYYNLRHEAQPGMTGMAQIKGYIGEINMERELRKRVQWDIYYLKNRSVLLDISILLTTVAQVFIKMLGAFRGKQTAIKASYQAG